MEQRSVSFSIFSEVRAMSACEHGTQKKTYAGGHTSAHASTRQRTPARASTEHKGKRMRVNTNTSVSRLAVQDAWAV